MSFFNDIANAIRFKKASSNPMPAGSFPSEIRSIRDDTTPIVNTPYTTFEDLFQDIADAIRFAGQTTGPIVASSFPGAINAIGVWNPDDEIDDPDNPFNGSGTEPDPWLIETPTQFAYLQHLVVIEEHAFWENETPRYYNWHDKYFKLMYNMAFNMTQDYDNWATNPPANVWTAIGFDPENGYVVGPFRANFDGNNHTISGIYQNMGGTAWDPDADNPNTGASVFGELLAPCTIKNLTVIKSYIKNPGDFIAGFASYARCAQDNQGYPIPDHQVIIDNCHFDGYIEAHSRIAGIVAEGQGVIIRNCTVRGTIKCGVEYPMYPSTGGGQMAGIVSILLGGDQRLRVGGQPTEYQPNYPDSKIINCTNHASVTAIRGGAAGIVFLSNGCDIDNCHNYGDIKAKQIVGGIMGHCFFDSSIKNSTNHGKIWAYQHWDQYSTGGFWTNGGNAGGLVAGVETWWPGWEFGFGQDKVALEMDNCVNFGEVSSVPENFGGDFEHVYPDNPEWNWIEEGIEAAANTGGLIGNVHLQANGAMCRIYNSYNMGEVQGGFYVGGIIGQCWVNDAEIDGANPPTEAGRFNLVNCYNRGNVTGRAYVGGLIGQFHSNNFSLTANCYSTGRIMKHTMPIPPWMDGWEALEDTQAGIFGAWTSEAITASHCYFLRTGTFNPLMPDIGLLPSVGFSLSNFYSFNGLGSFPESPGNSLLPALTAWTSSHNPYQAPPRVTGGRGYYGYTQSDLITTISPHVTLRDWQTEIWPMFVP